MTPKKPHLLTVLAIAAFLLIPFGISISGIATDVAESENRPPATLPTISEAPLDTETWDEVDAWLQDRIPLRELAIDTERKITDVVDSRRSQIISESPDVVEGPEGWLFLRRSLEQPCIEPETRARWVDEIQLARTVLNSVDKDLVIAIAPDRALVAPGQLPEFDNSCQIQNHETVADLAQSIGLVYLGDAVNNDSHALQTDTHWSPAGALAGAELIVEAIQPDLWDVSQVERDNSWERPGDLERMAGLDENENVPLVSFAAQRDVETERFKTASENHPLLRSVTGGTPDRRVFLVHDSYGGYSVGSGAEYVRPFFQNFDNMRVPGDSLALLGDAPVRESLTAADTVAFLWVQRAVRPRFESAQFVGPLVLGLEDLLEFNALESFASGTGWTVPARSGVIVLTFDGLAEETEIQADGLTIIGRMNIGQSAVLRVEGDGALTSETGGLETAKQLVQ